MMTIDAAIVEGFCHHQPARWRGDYLLSFSFPTLVVVKDHHYPSMPYQEIPSFISAQATGMLYQHVYWSL